MPDTKHGVLVRLPREKLRLHPACQLVPEMLPTEWAEFLADVGRRGILEPLTAVEMPLADGTSKEYLVVDGRHRLRAAEMEEYETVVCRLIELPSDQAAAYVIGAALHRRHLKESQRAVIAERFRQELAAKAKHTRTENASKSPHVGRPKNSGKSPPANVDHKNVPAGVTGTKKPNTEKDLSSESATLSKPRAENQNGASNESSPAKEKPAYNRDNESRAQAAKLFGVTEHQVRQAGVVLQNGSTELVRATEAGRVSLADAKKLAMLPLSKQRAILAAGDAAIKAALRQPEVKGLGHREPAVPATAEGSGVSAGHAERETDESLRNGLIRLKATEMLHAIHKLKVDAEQAGQHGYFAFALKHWTKQRRQELAKECHDLSEEMAFWEGKLLHSINFPDKEDE